MRRLVAGSNSSGGGSVSAAGGRRLDDARNATGGRRCRLIYHPSRRPSVRPSVRPRSTNVIVMSSFIGLKDGRSGRS